VDDFKFDEEVSIKDDDDFVFENASNFDDDDQASA